jgi:hypothetical protein
MNRVRMRIGFRTGWPFPNKAIWVIYVGRALSESLSGWAEEGRTLLRAAGQGQIADALVVEVTQ